MKPRAFAAAFAIAAWSASAAAQCVDWIAPIDDGALQRTRADLVRAATPSDGIRILAYIFDTDRAGLDMLRRLVQAAQRGVPVRLLIDGIGPGATLPIEDELIAALHDIAPRFEIRVFHPKADFTKLARRMHDKLFLVGDTGIIGSSSTWDASVDGWLIERDLLVRGDPGRRDSTLHAMRAHFDAFWRSNAAVAQRPADIFALASPYHGARGFKTLEPALIERWRRALSAAPVDEHGNNAGAPAIDDAPPATAWLALTCDRLRYVHDAPDKRAPGTLGDMLAALAHARTEIVVVNPYLILVPEMRALLERKQREGVRVVLVGASLERLAAELPAIGRAYANDLPALARAGLEIREYHDDANRMLHAKLVRIDGRRYYVGSFNFDPLSAYSNTENGLWIDPADETDIPPLAQTVALALAHSAAVTDGKGGLLASPDARCDAAGCGSVWRWLTPLVRRFL
ncbi:MULTISPECIES: phospholipase D-like domain-containing protein [Burkholderia]|uniref:phospholipase D-like domain-containing protein n=1 Tax=Burkholderia TaxID=32008 RepID=UPI00084141B0|nr:MULTISPECIES: phosphatidylserine/phosphatidylglycerophosphate/cardiolipin synthase family protein [unclassified Burkholderia]AOK30389.1 phospholipase [Burkholderia sp. Bp7605]